jgi:hypothetical protein
VPVVKIIDKCGIYGKREMIMEVEAVEENLPQNHFAYQTSHMICPEIEPGPSQWETGVKPPELCHCLEHILKPPRGSKFGLMGRNTNSLITWTAAYFLQRTEAF